MGPRLYMLKRCVENHRANHSKKKQSIIMNKSLSQDNRGKVLNTKETRKRDKESRAYGISGSYRKQIARWQIKTQPQKQLH